MSDDRDVNGSTIASYPSGLYRNVPHYELAQRPAEYMNDPRFGDPYDDGYDDADFVDHGFVDADPTMTIRHPAAPVSPGMPPLPPLPPSGPPPRGGAHRSGDGLDPTIFDAPVFRDAALGGGRFAAHALTQQPLVPQYPQRPAQPPLPPRPPSSSPIAGRPPAPRVDYEAVRMLRGQVGEALTRWLRTEHDATQERIDAQREEIAVEVVARYADTMRRGGTPLTGDDEYGLLVAVRADMVGLGRLQALLTDTTVEEVHILGCDRVRITRRNGVIDVGDPIADSDDEMVEVLQILARRAGATERSLSTSQPILDLQLPGGERLAATYQVSHRPYAVIRQHNTLDVTLDDIAGGRSELDEMIDPLMRDFLRAAVAAGLNIMVAGRAGAGKTTMLRALASEIPAEEPFILLEESRELGLHKQPAPPVGDELRKPRRARREGARRSPGR